MVILWHQTSTSLYLDMSLFWYVNILMLWQLSICWYYHAWIYSCEAPGAKTNVEAPSRNIYPPLVNYSIMQIHKLYECSFHLFIKMYDLNLHFHTIIDQKQKNRHLRLILKTFYSELVACDWFVIKFEP